AMWSYSIDAVNAFIEPLYQYAAATPRERPVIDPAATNPFMDTINAIGFADDMRAQQSQVLASIGSDWVRRTAYEKNVIASLGTSSSTAKTAYELKRYYNRPSPWRGPHGSGELPNRPEVPNLDFHERVALLMDHPILMRLLGLAIDVKFKLPPTMTMPPTGFI